MIHTEGTKLANKFWVQVVRVFFDPINLMESFWVRWSWLPAWMLAVVVTLVGQVPSIVKYNMYVDSLISSGQLPALLADTQRWATIASNAANPLVSALGQSLVCGAVMAFFSVFNAQAAKGFGRWFSVAMWASVPAAVGASIFKATVQLLYDGPAKMMFAGPAVLLGDQSHGALKALLVTLDVFSVWLMALCAVGTYVLNKRKLLPSILVGATLFAGYFLTNLAQWN